MLIDLKIREDILENFPNFEYFNYKGDCKRLLFNENDNLVGQQQEAFINFWIIKQIKEELNRGIIATAGLDIGCGQNTHLACIGCNDYFGNNHKIYGGVYKPNITSQAEDIHNKINFETINFIVASHILEHVDNPIVTFRNWCKLLRKNGIIMLLQPDSRYEVFGWDPTHKTYWAPEDFRKNCIVPNQDLISCEEFDTLKNKFSFNFIGRRI